MDTSESPKLLLQAEKILPQPIHPHLIACCPTMDLVAVVNQDEQLNVYRFGGQRAFGLQRRQGSSKVISLCWKFNGHYLAVGWSDGMVEVVSAETGNVLQHFKRVTAAGKQSAPNEPDTPLDVACIGWGLNFIDVPSIKAKIGKSKSSTTNGNSNSSVPELTTDHWSDDHDPVSLDDFLERFPDQDKIEVPLDLPEQISRIDITELLPKLPALPLLPPGAYKHGDHPAAELFSSQSSMDPLLHGTKSPGTLNGLDALLLAQSDGTVRLVFYDSLSIGSISVPTNWDIQNLRFLKHASHPFSRSHMFLAQIDTEEASSPKTVLIPLSLRFMQSAGSHLYMIEHKTAQLETLVQYVNECLLAISHHWAHAKDLPGRFMENINETLTENQEPSLVQSLFHLAVTGDCPPTLKEWLVDILAERGHKRWDQAISHGYTKVLELTHENLLPALDRCSIVLGHLKGLAEYHDHSPVFNAPVSSFDSILNIIRCMRLLAHLVLRYASEESRQFLVFSRWLRHEIDIQALDPSSASAEETSLQDMGTDYSQLLAYIQRPMEESKLDSFISLPKEGSPSSVADASTYEEMKKSIDAFKKMQTGNLGIINIHSHFAEWQHQNRTLVDQITSHQRASSAMSCGIVLETGNVMASDLRVVSENIDHRTNLITTYTAVVPDYDSMSYVNIRRLVHSDIFDDLKGLQLMAGQRLSFARSKPKVQILDVKFVDDEQLMLLLHEGDYTHLASFKYRGDQPDIALETNVQKAREQSQLPHGSPFSIPVHNVQAGALEWRSRIKHTFGPEDMLKPLKIEINGRQNRRFVVVVGDDLRQLRILDLDYSEGDELAESARTRNENGDDLMSE
ncbi:hypothetical protein E6O75_ATG10532 [Venturia nashicola]|uniref:Anaphase-promoting complex subunit 4 n=1 Tax=Venturia nashicola TaxID=86259 RepID=A0A4Z1PAF9_9PEZI|nr:hypothetical protein E6O75_ATG10532 [Venturia nashicola]